MSPDQISKLNVEAAKVNAIGAVLNFLKPDDFPTAGDSIYMDLGEILSTSASRIEQISADCEQTDLNKWLTRRVL